MLNQPCIGYGKFIRESREFKGLSAEHLANQLNVSEVVIERLEQDLLQPSQFLINKLSIVLNIDETELYKLVWCNEIIEQKI